MQQHRQFMLLGQSQLPLKQLQLHLGFSLSGTIIQPDLADGHDLIHAQRLRQGIQSSIGVMWKTGMQPQCGIQTGRGGRQVEHALKVIHSDRRHHDLLHASGAGTRDDRFTVGIKLGKVEVAVGIDQHGGSMAQA